VLVSTTLPHDRNSIYAQPLFASNPPVSIDDFRLGPASKAIGAGTPGGLAQDFSGALISTNQPPDIGAFELISASKPISPPSWLHAVGQ